MKTLKVFLQKINDILSMKKYVDCGVIDFSGQGKNKYGK